MTDYTETEVKFYMPDLPGFAQRLEATGAELTAPRVYERNVRYENAEKSLTERGLVVRLRQDTRVRLTYKEPPPTGSTISDLSHRFEAEVEVSDFDTMEVILGKLGYFPHLVYEKYRTTYQLDGVEVVLDEMPYGGFIELEGAADAIENVIQKLDLQNQRRYATNYISLFENVRHNLGLDFTDLTFANFEGIEVTEQMFVFPGSTNQRAE
ncbi:MAG: class IV adenylate cyclase [bacterium]|nr:class IV adenylate cyclase [bacterium]